MIRNINIAGIFDLSMACGPNNFLNSVINDIINLIYTINPLCGLPPLQDSSGLVISVITVIARVSSGGLVIGIQSFYPEKE